MGMRKITILLFVVSTLCSAQDKTLPYYEIPDSPTHYTAGTVAARMIDGLGFRFYWATEGLRAEDLNYRPGPSTRTSLQTIEHIFGMSIMIVNSTTGTANENPAPTLPFVDMRKQTLLNLKAASDHLKTLPDEEISKLKMVFRRDGQVSEFPFWNELNGPIADCLWHVGQIVSFRRASGNPFPDHVSVLTGKVIH